MVVSKRKRISGTWVPGNFPIFSNYSFSARLFCGIILGKTIRQWKIDNWIIYINPSTLSVGGFFILCEVNYEKTGRKGTGIFFNF